MEEYLQIGVITTTHGVRGEVKVYPTTDPERFLSLDRVFLDTGKEKKELHVTGVRFFKQLAIVKFKGIDNINDIERYKGCSLYVTREDAIPLEEDEYYIADLQGMQMYTEDGELFGTLGGGLIREGFEGHLKDLQQVSQEIAIRRAMEAQKKLAHRVCKNCGYYKGVQVIDMTEKQEKA